MNSSGQNEREETEQEQSGAAEEGPEHFRDVARGEEGEPAAAAADPGGEHL